MRTAVAQSWRALQFASLELRADPEIVRMAVAQSWRALDYASEELLRADPEIVRMAIAQNAEALRAAPRLLRQDRGLRHAAGRQLILSDGELAAAWRLTSWVARRAMQAAAAALTEGGLSRAIFAFSLPEPAEHAAALLDLDFESDAESED